MVEKHPNTAVCGCGQAMEFLGAYSSGPTIRFLVEHKKHVNLFVCFDPSCTYFGVVRVVPPKGGE